ncbi:MAG: hypothetical protein RLZZ297_460 [Chloroflexota bacterium]|jgi:thioredoxin-related protein
MGCAATKPIVHGIEQDYAGTLRVVYLDARDASQRAVATELRVEMTPSYVLFDRAGSEIWRATGPFSRTDFDRIVEKLT